MKKVLLLGFLALGALYAKVDINHAKLQDLMTLNGIGEAKAKAILDYRKKHCFKTLMDLSQVKGIGEKTILKNKREITVGRCSGRGLSGSTTEKTKTSGSKKVKETKKTEKKTTKTGTKKSSSKKTSKTTTKKPKSPKKPKSIKKQTKK